MSRISRVLFLLVIFSNLTFAEDIHEGSIKYMDKLKVCEKHTFAYPHPMIKGFTGKNIIIGKDGDKCKVELHMPNNMKMNCNFSKECVVVLTSAKAYEAARNKKMSGSTKSAESKCMQKECKM